MVDEDALMKFTSNLQFPDAVNKAAPPTVDEVPFNTVTFAMIIL